MILEKHPLRLALALFFFLLGIWLLASGHYTSLIITFGVGSCLLVVWLARRMEILDTEAMPTHMLLGALRYLPWLIRAVVQANIDVARRILSRRPSLSPRVIEAPTTQKTDLGRVLFANSITLTPGTVSIRVTADAIEVHAIAEEVAEELLNGEMDRQVTRMEGLD